MRNFALTLLLLSASWAQEMFLLPSQGKNRLTGEVVVNFFPDGDSVDVDVAIQFPRNCVQFIKSSDRYVARFRISIALYSENEMVCSAYINDSIITETYGAKGENEFISPSSVRFKVSPGKYELITIFKDINTDGETRASRMVKVPGAETIKISHGWFCDPVTGKKILQREITADYESLWFCARVFKIPAETKVFGILEGVRYRARRSNGFVRIEEKETLATTQFSPIELPGGKYEITIEIISGEGKKWASTKFDFMVIPTTNSLYRNKFDDLIPILELIAQPSEIESLLETEDSRRDSLWKNFWQRRDPVPTTEQNEFRDEFDRRLKFVSINFATTIRPGWETDRGKIYIQYGEPEEIERHPFDISSRAYEIWYYYSLGLKFVFVDTYGDGDYQIREIK